MRAPTSATGTLAEAGRSILADQSYFAEIAEDACTPSGERHAGGGCCQQTLLLESGPIRASGCGGQIRLHRELDRNVAPVEAAENTSEENLAGGHSESNRKSGPDCKYWPRALSGRGRDGRRGCVLVRCGRIREGRIR